MKLTFLGAAGEVTGSQHLIETKRLRVLLDCGLFQGNWITDRERNSRFAFEPESLDAVILSHAHIDHCGNLPGLYRAGFRGPIFCSAATADMTDLMLRDSVRIQAEDARYLNRLHLDSTGFEIAEPLYGDDEVRSVVALFESLEFNQWHALSSDFRLRFSNAGHILGSSISELEIWESGDFRRVVYTGDLGRRGLPLLGDPESVPGTDILITESTYGNHVHPWVEQTTSDLIEIIRRAQSTEGKVIIPAFSLGRTQQLIYYFKQLFDAQPELAIPVFVDSPLAHRVTSVYQHHQDLLAIDVEPSECDPFHFADLTMIATRQESLALNDRRGPCVIISAAGMCENGRIVHHLKHAVEDDRNTIVIVGFQARGTLGRRIAERHNTIPIHGQQYRLNASVVRLEGMSSHADAVDFKWWFEQMAAQTGIGQSFIVHGETDAAESLASLLVDYCDEAPIVPSIGDCFEV